MDPAAGNSGQGSREAVLLVPWLLSSKVSYISQLVSWIELNFAPSQTQGFTLSGGRSLGRRQDSVVSTSLPPPQQSTPRPSLLPKRVGEEGQKSPVRWAMCYADLLAPQKQSLPILVHHSSPWKSPWAADCAPSRGNTVTCPFNKLLSTHGQESYPSRPWGPRAGPPPGTVLPTPSLSLPVPSFHLHLATDPQKVDCGTSLVVRWLRICLPMQGTQVRALIWEWFHRLQSN